MDSDTERHLSWLPPAPTLTPSTPCPIHLRTCFCPTYSALLQALTDAIAPNRQYPFDSLDCTLDVDGTEVSLRYPAQGDENSPDRIVSYRLLIKGKDAGGALPPDRQVTIEAPGTAPFLAVVYELLEASDEEMMITALGRDDHLLWQLDPATADTCPFLYQLDGLDDLWVNIDGDVYDFDLMPRLGGTADGVAVSIGSA